MGPLTTTRAEPLLHLVPMLHIPSSFGQRPESSRNSNFPTCSGQSQAPSFRELQRFCEPTHSKDPKTRQDVIHALVSSLFIKQEVDCYPCPLIVPQKAVQNGMWFNQRAPVLHP